MNSSNRAALAMPIVLAASLFAQEPPAGATAAPALIAALRTPIHTHVGGEAGEAYGVWAAGPGYKASFDGGMRFVPFVAKGATSVSLAWRTVSARVGTTELATTAAPQLRHTAWRAEYDLGGIVEAYEVREDGLEQTFVLAQRPAASGDLVIRGAVTTALQASASEGHGDVVYADAAGAPFVRYGAAVAIDARGERCPMTTATVEGGLELRLAGGWLATATFPLVVDPLLAAVTVASGSEMTGVNLVYDSGSPSLPLWYALTRVSGTDEDLWLLRCDSDGSNYTVVYSDLSASWSAVEPTLGRNAPTQKVALAYTREIFAGNTRRIRGHVHARPDVGFSAVIFDVPNPGGENHWRPSLGEEMSVVSFTSLPLVFQVENAGAFANGNFSKLWKIDVLCAAAGGTANMTAFAVDAGTDHERPSVGQSFGGPTALYTCAYQRYEWAGAAGFEWNVAVRRFGGGMIFGDYMIDDGTPDRHEMAPRVAGRDTKEFVVYTASTIAESIAKPGGANGHRIRGTRLDWSGGGATLTSQDSHDLQVNGDARLVIAGLDFDWEINSIWGLAFRSTATEAVYFRTYGYEGLQLTDQTVHTPAVGLGTSVIGDVAYQAADEQFLIGYGANEPGVGNYARLRRWEYAPLAPISTTGSSCTTTTLDWDGTRRIGSNNNYIGYDNAPPSSFTLCGVATQTASLQLFGIGGVEDGCWLLVPLSGPEYLGMLPVRLGTFGNWHLPLPAGLPNMTLNFQAITFDPADGLLHSSARYSVPIGL